MNTIRQSRDGEATPIKGHRPSSVDVGMRIKRQRPASLSLFASSLCLVLALGIVTSLGASAAPPDHNHHTAHGEKQHGKHQQHDYDSYTHSHPPRKPAKPSSAPTSDKARTAQASQEAVNLHRLRSRSGNGATFHAGRVQVALEPPTSLSRVQKRDDVAKKKEALTLSDMTPSSNRVKVEDKSPNGKKVKPEYKQAPGVNAMVEDSAKSAQDTSAKEGPPSLSENQVTKILEAIHDDQQVLIKLLDSVGAVKPHDHSEREHSEKALKKRHHRSHHHHVINADGSNNLESSEGSSPAYIEDEESIEGVPDTIREVEVKANGALANITKTSGHYKLGPSHLRRPVDNSVQSKPSKVASQVSELETALKEPEQTKDAKEAGAAAEPEKGDSDGEPKKVAQSNANGEAEPATARKEADANKAGKTKSNGDAQPAIADDSKAREGSVRLTTSGDDAQPPKVDGAKSKKVVDSSTTANDKTDAGGGFMGAKDDVKPSTAGDEVSTKPETAGEKEKGKKEGKEGGNGNDNVKSDKSDKSGGKQECDETLKGELGSEYKGCQKKTRQGLECQAWNSQEPHAHDTQPADGADTNYCRNPSPKTHDTIWCYTMDPDEPFGYCDPLDFAKCDESTGDESNLGSDYRGCQSLTVSGKTCQSWTHQSPHPHTVVPETHPDKGLGDHTFCRNPDPDAETHATIWCYTTDAKLKWETCEPIQKASTKDKTDASTPVVPSSSTTCEVGDWGDWSACSALCNTGHRSRSRPMTKPPPDGESCDLPLGSSEICNDRSCPCEANPCVNAELCLDTEQGDDELAFKCVCDEGYRGPTCEEKGEQNPSTLFVSDLLFVCMWTSQKSAPMLRLPSPCLLLGVS
eukprot:GHVN01041961.1.p1 GENE.GHVN01041961.1~~GHVN01041961.1.p1  ORF type:complete len:861 (+),score=133.39 GHVN01041961.1:334-2916(+)